MEMKLNADWRSHHVLRELAEIEAEINDGRLLTADVYGRLAGIEARLDTDIPKWFHRGLLDADNELEMARFADPQPGAVARRVVDRLVDLADRAWAERERPYLERRGG